MSSSQKVCFTYPLNESFAGLLAIVENNKFTSNICTSNSDIISAPIYKIGDKVAVFDYNSGITELKTNLFLVISSLGFYIGIFENHDIAESCYATALTLEESFAKMYKKN